jgi:hypothetical protein
MVLISKVFIISHQVRMAGQEPAACCLSGSREMGRMTAEQEGGWQRPTEPHLTPAHASPLNFEINLFRNMNPRY